MRQKGIYLPFSVNMMVYSYCGLQVKTVAGEK